MCTEKGCDWRERPWRVCVCGRPEGCGGIDRGVCACGDIDVYVCVLRDWDVCMFWAMGVCVCMCVCRDVCMWELRERKGFGGRVGDVCVWK